SFAAPTCCSRPTATTSRNTFCRTVDGRPLAARHPFRFSRFLEEISHGTRQTRRHRSCQAQESTQGRQGLLRPAQEHHPHCQAGGGEGQPIRLSQSQKAEAHVPCL